MYENSNVAVAGPDDLIAYLRASAVPLADNVMLAVGLGWRSGDRRTREVIGLMDWNQCGSALGVDAPRLIACATLMTAPTLAIVTSLAGGPRIPSRSVVDRFVALRSHCRDAGLEFLEWIVVAEHHWWSLQELAVRSSACGIVGA